jgi:hypothetical protein
VPILKTIATPRSNRFPESFAHFLLRISTTKAGVVADPERRGGGRPAWQA